MDFYDFVAAIWRRKVAFTLILSLFLFGGALFLKVTPPIFEASTLVLADSSRSLSDKAEMDAYNSVQQQDRYVNAQVKIAESEGVIADAITQFKKAGVDIAPQQPVANNTKDQTWPPLRLLDEYFKTPANSDPDLAIAAVQRALNIEVEPNTSLLKISFRDPDAQKAQLFANYITNSLIIRNSKLASNPLATQFFRDQVTAASAKLAELNQKLEQFSVANQAYSVDEQRTLLLKHRDKASADLASLRSDIQKNDAELQSMKVQLSALKGKINLPAAIFGQTNFNADTKRGGGDGFGDDPSLLHVKMYQEGVQQIVTLNAQLAGLHAAEANQARELADSDIALQALTQNEARFNELKREVGQAEEDVKLYTKKATDAEIANAWQSNERLSTLQLVQSAVLPTRPAFPKPSLILPLAMLAGLVAGSVVVLAFEAKARRRGVVEAQAGGRPARRFWGSRFGLKPRYAKRDPRFNTNQSASRTQASSS